MDKYLPQLEKRQDKGDTPYNLRNCAYIEDFNRQKIIYPNMTKFMPFYLDNNGFYTNQKCFIVTGSNIGFLTAFLNSSLFKFCYIDNFPKLGEKGRELSKIFFDKISVIQPDDNIEEQFMSVVIDIQKQYTKEKAITIDKMLFSLYGLTEKEQKAIGFIEIK